jgi:hypothetical protein
MNWKRINKLNNHKTKPPHMKNTKLTTDQHWAIRCACADLIGSLEGKNKRLDHDWKGHKQTIAELLSAFPDVLSDFKTGGSEDAEYYNEQLNNWTQRK